MRLAEPGAFRGYLLLTIFCGGAAFVCAAGWWHQTSVLQDLDARIAVGEERIRNLEAIKVQVDAFQAKRHLLEKEIALIEGLNREKAAAAKPAGRPPAGGAASKKP